MAVIVGLGVGLAILVALLRSVGLGGLESAVTRLPLPVALAVAWRLVTLVWLAVSWGRLVPRGRRPSRLLLVKLRWIGEAINALLPVAQVGGDVARARLLAMIGVPAGVAAAALVVDLVAANASQAAFVLLALLAASLTGRGTGLARPSLIAIGVVVGAVLACALLLRAGIRRGVGQSRLRSLIGRQAARVGAHAQEVRAALGEVVGRRRDVAFCFSGHLIAWCTQVVETWGVLWLIGSPVTWSTALMLEGVSSMARTAAFAIPGGVGVQESALVYVGLPLGVPAQAALTLGLVKRARELVVGTPGVVVWMLSERTLLSRLVRKVTSIGDAPARARGRPRDEGHGG